MKRIPRRIFQEEFKREAIKLVNEQGLTISEACKKLDIATKSLRSVWEVAVTWSTGLFWQNYICREIQHEADH